MSEKKKHSGSYYRKRRSIKNLEEEKQAAGLKRFLSGSSSVPSTPPEVTADSEVRQNPVDATLQEEIGSQIQSDMTKRDSKVLGTSSRTNLCEVSCILNLYRLLSRFTKCSFLVTSFIYVLRNIQFVLLYLWLAV